MTIGLGHQSGALPVEIWTRNSATGLYDQITKLSPSVGTANFGQNLEVNADVILVGTHNENAAQGPGHAFVYVKDASSPTGWTETVLTEPEPTMKYCETFSAPQAQTCAGGVVLSATLETEEGCAAKCGSVGATCATSSCPFGVNCAAAVEEPYARVGDGVCMTKERPLYASHITKQGAMDVDECETSCDAVEGCGAFQYSVRASLGGRIDCVLFGNTSTVFTASTVHPAGSGWTFVAGNGGSTISEVNQNSEYHCFRKNEAWTGAATDPSTLQRECVCTNGTMTTKKNPFVPQTTVCTEKHSSNWQAGNSFGYSVDVSADGQKLVVGCPRSDHTNPANTDENAGAAYVFDRTEDGGWVLSAMLKPHDHDQDDEFYNETIIATLMSTPGVNGPDSAGNAYVWGGFHDGRSFFGNSVAIDKDAGGQYVIAVAQYMDAAMPDGSSSGAVYMFIENEVAAATAPIARTTAEIKQSVLDGCSTYSLIQKIKVADEHDTAPNSTFWASKFFGYGTAIDLSTGADMLVLGGAWANCKVGEAHVYLRDDRGHFEWAVRLDPPISSCQYAACGHSVAVARDGTVSVGCAYESAYRGSVYTYNVTTPSSAVPLLALDNTDILESYCPVNAVFKGGDEGNDGIQGESGCNVNSTTPATTPDVLNGSGDVLPDVVKDTDVRELSSDETGEKNTGILVAMIIFIIVAVAEAAYILYSKLKQAGSASSEEATKRGGGNEVVFANTAYESLPTPAEEDMSNNGFGNEA